MGVRVVLHQEANCCTNLFLYQHAYMHSISRSPLFFFFFRSESESRWRGDSKHFPNPCFTSLLSALLHPKAPFFSPQRQKLGSLFPRRRYWAVSQINCQCPGHFTGSSNYILGRLLARAPRSCGAAIVIEASLGYRWIVRERRAKASQSSLASVERLYSSSPSSRGQGVLSWSSMRLAVC